MINIGQKVVCVRGYKSTCGKKLVEGETYTIKGVSSCKCAVCYNVGFSTEKGTSCFTCFTDLGVVGEWWHNANRFLTLEEYQESENAVKELCKDLGLQLN